MSVRESGGNCQDEERRRTCIFVREFRFVIHYKSDDTRILKMKKNLPLSWKELWKPILCNQKNRACRQRMMIRGVYTEPEE